MIQTGEIELNGVKLLRDVGAARKRAKLFGGDGVCLGDTADARSGGLPSKVARRFRCTVATLAPSAFGADGRRVFKDYSARYGERNPDPYAIYGYESMALLLDSIERAIASGGGQSAGGGGSPGYQNPLRRQTVRAAATGDLTRMQVVSALFATKDRRSVLGTYSIDPNGDTTLVDYGLYRIVRGHLAFDRTVQAVRP